VSDACADVLKNLFMFMVFFCAAIIMLLAVRPSTRRGKKRMAIFSNGTVRHFGCASCKDYIYYKRTRGDAVATAKRDAYIARHRVRESWKDPYAPSTLSRYILWEFEPEEAVSKYNKKFFGRRRRQNL